MSERKAAELVKMPRRTLTDWKTTKPELYRLVMDNYRRLAEKEK